MPKKVRLIYFFIFVVVFVVAIPLILLYASGYSFDTALNLSWRGGVYVYVPESDVEVFIGNNVRTSTSLLQHEIIKKNLHPGGYLILVANENYWPWAKFVDVRAGEVAARFPLLVPKVMPFVEIPKKSTEYKSVSALFATSTLSNGKKAISKNIQVSAEERSVVVSWLAATSSAPYFFCFESNGCQKTFTAFTAGSDIQSVDFYPGRDDAIILTLGTGVYAVELDHSLYHNVYPIFRGTDPEIRVVRNTIYVKDKDYIAAAEL